MRVVARSTMATARIRSSSVLSGEASHGVDVGPDDGQGAAQLVGGVVDQLPLRQERALQAAEHGVDGVGEVAELVLGAGEQDPPRQVGALDLGGGPW
ncbi:hypothetical protein GCM10017559_71940 [Streptosporangium longisporum]|uniref:Uncharacterized protein n=2 Tax=Streptosporangium longisporum TaxID=46187 RepID=A0ABP6LBL1_9ACTN